ncbi:hypothetical protein [Halomonas sp. H5]|uniref:hypothetical protein n=1 Tax=Halomonas sp. H5 TaxID=3423910 RepID=UPI003D35C8F1
MRQMPSFPTQGHHITHCRAALALLLSGERVDQFVYHQRTGLPLVDFRTRISNLTIINRWPIEREFHLTYDFNDEPRRVMEYWLDRARLAALYRANPDFKARCEAFKRKYGDSLCRAS